MSTKFRQDIRELSVSIKTNAPRIERQALQRDNARPPRSVVISAGKYNSALEKLAKE
jgi:hypothetical protein